MVQRFDVTGADGVRLAAWEFRAAAAEPPREPAEPSREPAALLLHGLMGRAFHWAGTARWLCANRRVVALDQRGHGQSARPPVGSGGSASYGREAFVADAEAVIEQLGLAPVTLIGHSMGALTAWQLAARRPDLVAALVICDMRASALGEASQQEWEDWFRRWPLPFPTQDAARRWFGEDDPRVERPDPGRGAFFAEVMHEADDGWRPLFSRSQMLTARETWVHDAHWEELAQVRCPTLVVRGLDGELGRAEAQEMVRVLPAGQYAEIPDAGHYLHYDQPTAWREAVEPFLDGIKTSA
ncbi:MULTISPECIES: alpha/beta hydrolase [unclassified Streptomyces]|uniref:alpha/beta fold hydrolase n=1 Tax=unclassified Streptomyces TaxID=2593676 RepID=UPI000DC7D3CE|nr:MULTISPECIES: alpha/beta hydrolase [unclassified Streptomyces]AWZ07334.1 alpha/beta hydrolase [Streptomyces sp. ICC4]AWZ15974.1 alpha/beta hydrolase [Streptomyces sp. ICC1]